MICKSKNKSHRQFIAQENLSTKTLMPFWNNFNHNKYYLKLSLCEPHLLPPKESLVQHFDSKAYRFQKLIFSLTFNAEKNRRLAAITTYEAHIHIYNFHMWGVHLDKWAAFSPQTAISALKTCERCINLVKLYDVIKLFIINHATFFEIQRPL